MSWRQDVYQSGSLGESVLMLGKREWEDDMQIDYLFGRTVESVEEGGADNAAWFIVLEGGAKIVVFDENYAIPDQQQLVNLALTSFTRSDEQVHLYFGTKDNPQGTVVNLPCGSYGISDDTYSQGEVVDPEVVTPPTVIPVDPEEQRRALDAEGPATEGTYVDD